MRDLVNSIPRKVDRPQVSIRMSKQLLFYVAMTAVLFAMGASLVKVVPIILAAVLFQRVGEFYKDISNIDFSSDDYDISMGEIISDLEGTIK